MKTTSIKLSAFAIGMLYLCVTQQYVFAQDQQNDFSKMRATEFRKLLGIGQEGPGLNYSAEKTTLEGKGGFEIKKAHLFIQLGGSIGTTTNLSSLFNQKILPDFSGNININWMIPKFSVWFYDGSFVTRNYDRLKAGSVAENLDTRPIEGSPAYAIVYKYKDELQERIISGETKKERLYTFKIFCWVNLAGKYTNSKYTFYDAAKPFTEQVFNPAYRAWTTKLSFNGYVAWNKKDVRWVHRIPYRPNFIYLNIAAQYGLSNNTQQLKKTTINDISSSTTNGQTIRQTVKTVNAYSGLYKEFNAFIPSFELIFSPVKYFALNAFGDYSLISKADRDQYNIQNYGSIATGIYFYGDKEVKLNIGVFYKWTEDRSSNTWVGQFGLKTSIPISPQ